MTELNPNHPVTRQMSRQWHKVCALLMVKMGVDNVVITSKEIMDMPADKMNIIIHSLPDGIHLSLVDDETAARLVDAEGGKPV